MNALLVEQYVVYVLAGVGLWMVVGWIVGLVKPLFTTGYDEVELHGKLIAQHQTMIENLRFKVKTLQTQVHAPLENFYSGVTTGTLPVKKRRGRPRKTVQ